MVLLQSRISKGPLNRHSKYSKVSQPGTDLTEWFDCCKYKESLPFATRYLLIGMKAGRKLRVEMPVVPCRSGWKTAE